MPRSIDVETVCAGIMMSMSTPVGRRGIRAISAMSMWVLRGSEVQQQYANSVLAVARHKRQSASRPLACTPDKAAINGSAKSCGDHVPCLVPAGYVF